jgi:hypothetical protein
MRQIFDVDFQLANGQWQEEPVVFAFNHWLAKRLKSGGVTLGFTVALAHSPYDGDPTNTAAVVYCHELGHVFQRVRRGFLGYWAMVLANLVFHRSHATRPMEREADRIGGQIFAQDPTSPVLPGKDFYDFLARSAGYTKPDLATLVVRTVAAV